MRHCTLLSLLRNHEENSKGMTIVGAFVPNRRISGKRAGLFGTLEQRVEHINKEKRSETRQSDTEGRRRNTDAAIDTGQKETLNIA